MKHTRPETDFRSQTVARETAVRARISSDPLLETPTTQLKAFLEVADAGYAICRCNSPRMRTDILESIAPGLAEHGIGVYQLDLDPKADSIPAEIRKTIAGKRFKAFAAKFDKVGISVSDIGDTIRPEERELKKRPAVIQGLNQQREWVRKLGRPVIFWVADWLMDNMRRIAPDFWGGRGIVLEFRAPKEMQAEAFQQLSTEGWLFDNLDQAKRKIRIYEDLLKGTKDPRVRAGFLFNLGIIHQQLGEYDKARGLYEQSLKIAEELGDKSGIAKTLHNLGAIYSNRGEYDKAREQYQQALGAFEELGVREGQAVVLYQLGNIHYQQGEYGKARGLYRQALETFEELGAKQEKAAVLHQLGNIHLGQGENDKARVLYGQSLKLKRELGDKRGIAQTLHQLGMIHSDQGEYDKARELYERSLKTAEELGDRQGIGESLAQLGQLAEAEKDDKTALRNWLIALSIFEELKSPNKNIVVSWLAAMQQRLGEEEFKRLYDEVEKELEQPEE